MIRGFCKECGKPVDKMTGKLFTNEALISPKTYTFSCSDDHDNYYEELLTYKCKLASLTPNQEHLVSLTYDIKNTDNEKLFLENVLHQMVFHDTVMKQVVADVVEAFHRFYNTPLQFDERGHQVYDTMCAELDGLRCKIEHPIGWCKECDTLIFRSDKMDGFTGIFECNKCGHPNCNDEYFPVPRFYHNGRFLTASSPVLSSFCSLTRS